MELQDVRTFGDLQLYLPQHVEIEEADLIEVIEWYVAMTGTPSAGDGFGRKDMARLFLDGIPPIKDNPKAIDDFIGTFFEDYDHYRQHDDEITSEELKELLEDATNMFMETLSDHFDSTYTP